MPNTCLFCLIFAGLMSPASAFADDGEDSKFAEAQAERISDASIRTAQNGRAFQLAYQRAAVRASVLGDGVESEQKIATVLRRFIASARERKTEDRFADLQRHLN